jgi:hypothetical protein
MFMITPYAGMSPLTQPNNCRHPKLENMVKFKDGRDTFYRCLICKAVVSSRDLDREERND